MVQPPDWTNRLGGYHTGPISGDLATRNVLVTDAHVAKLADFGLGRRLSTEDENMYTMSVSRALPARWMAPESLARGQWTVESDIWSFGVLGWEAFALAELPYADTHPEIASVIEFVNTGGRLSKPKHCPDEVYSLLNECWAIVPEARPKAQRLWHVLRKLNAVPLLSQPSTSQSAENPLYGDRAYDAGGGGEVIVTSIADVGLFGVSIESDPSPQDGTVQVLPSVSGLLRQNSQC